LTPDELQGEEFSALMVRLAQEHKLFPMMRYDSRHFVALSNADEGFSKSQLRNCELMYSLFYEHFRRKGFAVQQPSSRLMVAMFDSQAGFEAYLGRRMPPQVTGIYDPRSNRFVLYDFGQNLAFQASKGQAERAGQRIHLSMDRLRYLDGVERSANDIRSDTNLSTIMHEVAHQLSFNGSLLNREGDVPAWLAEGLACYCESSSNGGWQGIGEPSPQRLKALADCLGGQGQFLKLDDLTKSDRWLRGNTKTILLGYAQSWALFHLLMEEQPQALKEYLGLIYAEKTAERRAAAFQQAFGADLTRLERRYHEHMKSLVQLHLPVQP